MLQELPKAIHNNGEEWNRRFELSLEKGKETRKVLLLPLPPAVGSRTVLPAQISVDRVVVEASVHQEDWKVGMSAEGPDAHVPMWHGESC